MLLQQTIQQLQELQLYAMAQALCEQQERSDLATLSFEERLGLIVDKEYLARHQRRLKARLRKAQLKQSACVEDIDYQHPRNLDRKVMHELVTCRWMQHKQNVIVTGATGLGKSWLACALADNVSRWIQCHLQTGPASHVRARARTRGRKLPQAPRTACQGGSVGPR